MTIIRKAEISDAPNLAQLQERTFCDTFAADNDPADMALHCQQSYSAALQEQEIRNPQLITLVGVEGFAQVRRGPSPSCVDADQPAEILRLYIDKQWHGKGVAQQLMEQSLEQGRLLGAAQIWLGVWERNPRAISFYKKYGFVEVGEHVFMVGSDAQRDVIMTRSL
jgi:ribosomal protein S18 acetylase RimI-like enzyme